MAYLATAPSVILCCIASMVTFMMSKPEWCETIKPQNAIRLLNSHENTVWKKTFKYLKNRLFSVSVFIILELSLYFTCEIFHFRHNTSLVMPVSSYWEGFTADEGFFLIKKKGCRELKRRTKNSKITINPKQIAQGSSLEHLNQRASFTAHFCRSFVGNFSFKSVFAGTFLETAVPPAVTSGTVSALEIRTNRREMQERKRHLQWVEQTNLKRLSRSQSHLIIICHEQRDSMAVWNQDLEDQLIASIQ